MIAGGGCAGLSLAVELASAMSAGPRPRVIVVEPRARYVHDRTWCLWPVRAHAFESAVQHRWHRWQVRTATRTIRRESADTPYVHIPSGAFYERALACLQRCAEVEVRLGEAVTAIDDAGDHVVVTTPRGPLRARLAFDSRPAPAGPPGPGAADDVTILQHFVGWEVCVDRPCFDPSTATLMDFAVPQDDGIHFVYVLPFAADRALVEDTYMSATPLPTAVYEGRLRAYLAARFGVDAFEIGFRERGAIPMTTAAIEPRRSPRIIHIGVRGGAVRASTGYAFLAIQGQCRALAAQVLAAGAAAIPEPTPPRGAMAVTMDRVFLSHLDRRPDRAPELFADLFERLSPDLLIRFLSDVASPLECMRVMRALPMGEMSGAVLRARGRLLRRTRAGGRA